MTLEPRISCHNPPKLYYRVTAHATFPFLRRSLSPPLSFPPGIVQAPSMVAHAHAQFFTRFDGVIHALDVALKTGRGVLGSAGVPLRLYLTVGSEDGSLATPTQNDPRLK